MRLPGSDRVNQTHMVDREVWSNAAVGQRERRAWWGQNRRERTAGRTEIPTPAPGPRIQDPNSPTRTFLDPDHADGRSHRCVNFSLVSKRAGISCACVSRLSKQTFYFLTSGKRNCESNRIVSFPRSSAEGEHLVPSPAPRRRARGTQRKHPASSGISQAHRGAAEFHFQGRGVNLLLV